MNDMTHGAQAPDAEERSFRFNGTWQEFLPIAFTNLLLTIVTLGIYRFWAKARERRYLWSRTEFIDDSFEWTGTGLEMFIGFLIVMVVLLPVFLFFSFGFQALILRGYAATAITLLLSFYLGFFYLYNVARFRAIRYRLSRTFWHGIRGGSDDGGWGYGVSGMWKMAVGWLVFGFLVPWAMTSLWNERWNKMSFGPHKFEAWAGTDGLMGRWLLLYLAPVIGLLIVVVIGGGAAAAGAAAGGSEGAVMAGAGAAVVGTILFYLLFLLLSLSFYAAFFRQVAGATSVAGLTFGFTARTKDWLILILGNIGLVIITLGVGLLFLSYRNWKFIVSHMEASGEIDLSLLTQSATRAPGDAEGLADAFDIGAV